jgi:D-xylose transport system permease protein
MKSYLQRNGVWIGFLLLVLCLSFATGGAFFSPRNLSNLIRQASINGILAGGMTLVILTGGIDLSVGSVVALCGIFLGYTQVNLNWAALGVMGALGSAGLSLGGGLLMGVLSGTLIAFLGIAPFVITLGLMVIARGLALILSNGTSLSPMGDALAPLADAYLPMNLTVIFGVGFFLTYLITTMKDKATIRRLDFIFPLLTFALLSYGFLAYRGFPVPALVLLFVLLILNFILNRTILGRSLYAIGSNERAAFWAGISIKKTTILVYSIMGLLAGLAGLLLSARLNSADPNAGQLFELDAIAAVVIGGTSLKGGRGTIIGSFVGALTIASLNNGMDLLGISSFYQMLGKGIIIILAVGLDYGQRRK